MPYLLAALLFAAGLWIEEKLMGSGVLRDATREDKLAFAGHVRHLASQIEAMGVWEANPTTIPGLSPKLTRKIQGLAGIPVDMALSVFSKETGWGLGNVYLRSHNIGSIRRGEPAAWPGPVEQAGHRVYPSDLIAFMDFIRLMSTPVYATARAKAMSRDWKGYFQALEDAGYEVAIDPPYHVRLENAYAEVQALA